MTQEARDLFIQVKEGMDTLAPPYVAGLFAHARAGNAHSLIYNAYVVHNLKQIDGALFNLHHRMEKLELFISKIIRDSTDNDTPNQIERPN